jgi:uncharacterized protein YpmB
MARKSKIIISIIILLVILFVAKTLIIELGLPGKEYLAKNIALKYSPIQEMTSIELKWVDIKNFPFYKEGIIYSPVFYVVIGKDKFDREITVYVNNIDLKIHYVDYR